jgi:hypothetical protein
MTRFRLTADSFALVRRPGDTAWCKRTTTTELTFDADNGPFESGPPWPWLVTFLHDDAWCVRIALKALELLTDH